MTNLARIVITSEGYNGAPGYNIMNFSFGTYTELDKQEMANAIGTDLSTGYQSVQSYLVDEVTWSIGPTVQFFSAETGVIYDEVTASFSNPVITGTDSVVFIDRSACVNVAFRTNDFLNGRRLIGRSFVGPIGGGAFNADGQIHPSIAATFSGMFDALLSGVGPRLAVWHRPTSVQAADGAYGDVVTVTARGVPGTLRSRKV